MKLTGKALRDFNKYKPFYFIFLPEKYKLIIIYRWFAVHTKVPIEIWCREENGFDYFVQHPDKNINKVFTSGGGNGNYTKEFDRNLKNGIYVSNFLYNNPKCIDIPFNPNYS